MSHACVIVAVEGPRSKVEEQVAWEMQPFNENDEFFKDGSRWDWYQIGGRFTGMLDGYDPASDLANTDDRRQHSGDILQIKALNVEYLRQVALVNYGRQFDRHTAEPNYPFSDVEKNEDRQQYIDRKMADWGFSAYAFLKNRHWHEGERMGWFGTSTFTECERKDLDKPVSDPDKWFSKCLYKMPAKKAQIVCWNEPYEIWKQEYYRRFIAPMAPETFLVAVDYHV